MKIISEKYKPRRTGLMADVAEAKLSGRKRIPLKTAVDVYGALNITGQLRIRKGIHCAVRRWGSGLFLVIDPAKRKPRHSSTSHARLRKTINSLKKGECLLLTTPLEVFKFHNVRATLLEQGTEVRCKRNCTNLMVWKTRSAK